MIRYVICDFLLRFQEVSFTRHTCLCVIGHRVISRHEYTPLITVLYVYSTVHTALARAVSSARDKNHKRKCFLPHLFGFGALATFFRKGYWLKFKTL